MRRRTLPVVLSLVALAAVLPCVAEEDPPAVSPAEAVPVPESSNVRTLTRQYDAVVVKGETLGVMLGEPVSGLRLYAWREGALHKVPFQVDERDPDGAFVLTSGPMARNDVDRGMLDFNDELVFLVMDAGDRAPEGPVGPEGLDKWAEIELRDPLRLGEKAWVYLCAFAGPPPEGSSVDYVRYDPEAEQILSSHYKLGYRSGMSLYTDLHYPDGKGGYGPDLLDRIKVRIVVKFLFSIVKKKVTEDDFRAEVVAWKDGPVRVLRNVQNYVRILFNLSSASVFSVSEYYPWYMYTPLRLTIPFDLKWVFGKFAISDWYWYFYGDLPGLEGGYLYTNRNTEGIPVSTEHDLQWYEERFDDKYLIWGYATKEGAGTWFCNMLIPDATYQFIRGYLHIDTSKKNPPEDVPGELAGGALMNFKDVDRKLWKYLAPGTYGVGLETFFAPPGLTPAGVPQWRNIREFPLLKAVTRCEPACPARGSAESQRKKQSPEFAGQCRTGYPSLVTDVGGHQTILYDTRVHFGSMTASGWDWVLGPDMQTGAWHQFFFNEVASLENRIGHRDPLTGMEHPMVIHVTLKDGKSLDIMGCKSCTVSGVRIDGRKQGYAASELTSVKFLDPDSLCLPVPPGTEKDRGKK